MPFREFQSLQEDGIYSSSGGAATNYYERLHFEKGTFWVELLGNTDRDYYSIKGQEVSESEFEIWRKELLVGEVPWYIARAIQ